MEFQTSPKSTPPIPLRMLDYWVRLYRQYNCDIEQVVIFLKPTTSETAFFEQFSARNTSHRYRVIRMWEQDPEPLLASPGLLPLATLARTNSAQTLLEQVAAQVSIIEETATKQSISVCTQLLVGLVFEQELIHQLFKREDMRESVIYQEILQEGIEQGIEQGRQQALTLLMRQINHKFGSVSPELQTQIQALSFAQLQDLGEALFDFNSEIDLVSWLSRLGS